MIVRAALAAGFACSVLGAPAGPAEAAEAWRPPLPPPVAVLRPFEQPSGPYGPGHRGVDLAARNRAVVRAAAAGTVLVAGTVAGTAVVVLGHGAARTDQELRTTYQPVLAEVTVGERVTAGAALGRLGDWPGHCERSCLHWGLRRGTTYLDPMLLLRGPVRLLPAGPPEPVAARPPAPVRTPARAPVQSRGSEDGVRSRASEVTAVPALGRAPSGLAVGAVAGAGAAAGALLLARRARRRRSAA